MVSSAEIGRFDLKLGFFAALAAAVSYGAGAVYGKRLGDAPPIINASAMLTCSSLILAPTALMVEVPMSKDPAASHWLAVVALALLSSAIAYLLYFDILKSSGATNLSLVTFLIPIVSVLMGILILGERIQSGEIIGMAIPQVVLSGYALYHIGLATRAQDQR